jgi:hypothetical protein
LRLETAHTQSLAWLLDERQPHGFGRQLLDAFLDAVDCSEVSALGEIRGLIRQTRAGPTNLSAEYRLEAGRADLFAKGTLANGESWSLVVEAKIDAAERAEQLSDYYRKDTANGLHVFLTPEGARGVTVGASGEWATLSFRALARSFLAAHAELHALPDRPPGCGFLQTYITGVLSDVCGIHCSQTAELILARTNPYRIEALLGKRDEQSH